MAEINLLEHKFAMLAFENGFATKKQVIQALHEQKQEAAQGKNLLLGDIMVQAKVITEEQKNEIIRSQKELLENFSAKNKKPPYQGSSKEEPPDFEGAKRIKSDSGFELAITANRMQAYISAQKKNSTEAALETIKGLIEMEGLTYGIIEDEKIKAYLASEPKVGSLFKIAQGLPMNPGKQTEIKYHFDTNPLKPATIGEDGKIDYKNRWEIPQVKAKDLLAERIPGTEGESGTDIYEQTIDPPPPDLVNLTCGRGAKKSEDSSKVFAEIDGRPELLDDGTINVSDTLPIDGDVGVETGHIIFDGHIRVRGAVQEGYTVKGKTLIADEIHNAQLEIEGDIKATKGIIGSSILTDGTVQARHIRDTTIDSLGDVSVEREIYESRIETNGILNISRGTILGSTISALKGIEAAEVGSEASDPCTLVIGIDNRAEKGVTKLHIQIAQKEKEQEKLKSLIAELKDKPHELEEKKEELAQQQDQVMVKGKPLKETLKSLKKANDQENMIKVVKIIKALNLKLGEIQNGLDSLLKKRNKVEATITKYNEEIEKIGEEIKELQDDIKAMLEMAKISNSSASVQTTGKIFDRTAIRGRNASLIVKETLQRVLIQEAKSANEDSGVEWAMNVSSLR